MIGLIVPFLPVFAWEVVDEWHLLKKFRRDYQRVVRRGGKPDLSALAKLLQHWLGRDDFRNDVLGRVLNLNQRELDEFTKVVEMDFPGDPALSVLYLKAHELDYRLEALDCTDPLCHQTEWEKALKIARELLMFLRTYQATLIMDALGDLSSNIHDLELFDGVGVLNFVNNMHRLESRVTDFLSSLDKRRSDG